MKTREHKILKIISKKALHLQGFFIFLLLFTLPFNLTKQLPDLPIIPAAYTNGYFINYLLSYISIQDIAGMLFMIASIALLLINKERLSRNEKLLIFVWSSYMMLHNAIFMNFTTLLYSLRVSLFITVFIFARRFLQKLFHSPFKYKAYNLTTITIAISILVQFIIATSQFLQGSSIGLWYLGESQISQGMINSSFLDIKGTYFLRGYGTFPHPNLLGGFLVIMILMLKAIKYEIEDDRVIKLLISCSALLALGTILITFSRISLVLGMTILIADQLEAMIKYINTRVMISFPLSERLFSFLYTADISLIERSKLTQSAIDIIRSSPWIGVGWQGFTATLSHNPPITVNGISLIQPVHNIFLLVVAENGIIFGSLIAIALAGYFIWSFKLKEKRLITTLSLIILLTIGLWDHYFVTLPQGNLLLVTLALIPIIYSRHSNKSTQYPLKGHFSLSQ